MDLVKKTPAEKEEAFRLLQKLYASEPIKPRKPPAPLPETLQQLRAMEKDGESRRLLMRTIRCMICRCSITIPPTGC